MHKPYATLADKQEEKKLFRARFAVLVAGLFFLTIVLIGRLFYLSVTQFHLYQTLAKQNQINTLAIPPTRGLISDRNGTILAKNSPVFSLELLPEKIKDLAKTIEQLRKFVALNEDEIKAFNRSLRQHRRFEWVPLKMKLSEEEVAQFSVNKLHFPGIEVKARLIRSYPFGKTLAHVLGFVGRINEREHAQIDPVNYRGTHFIGKVGIEKYYEDGLHGTVGEQQVEMDASSRIVRTLKKKTSQTGAHLTLTIDIELQKIAEEALADQQGSVVAIDPSSGEILALSSMPSYDPNLFVQGISHIDYAQLANSSRQPLFNRAIRGQYPLASTIKPFTALKALEDNIVSTDYRVFDPGWFRLPNTKHLYRDWKRIGHGWVDLKQALIVSCDTYFYKLSELMGIKRIDDVLHQFGFGQLTQIDMGEELAGLIPSPEWKRQEKRIPWYTGDTIISGIGQGFMLTTPLQLANGVAKLANRGKSYRPHLLKSWLQNEKSNAKLLLEEFPIKFRKEAVWETVINAMAASVTRRDGTGGYRFGRTPPYTVAIKTGTAQVYSIKQNQSEAARDVLPEYLRDHSIVIAFAPVDKPKIALAVLVENNNIASHVARKIIDNYLLRVDDASRAKPAIHIEPQAKNTV